MEYTKQKPKKLKVEFDYALYAHHLDDEPMSEAEKEECLAALWMILSEFVMLGFDVHPAQQAKGGCACGQLAQNLPQPANTNRAALYSSDTDKDKTMEEFAHGPA